MELDLDDPHGEAYREAERTPEGTAEPPAPNALSLRQLAQLLTAGEGRHKTGAGPTDPAQAPNRGEARYRTLIEQVPAVTFMAPLDGSVGELYVSPQIEQLLGFTAEEWRGNPLLWSSQLHPDDQERWKGELARTLSAGERYRSEYRFIARDGRVVWVRGEARVVGDGSGRPLFLNGIALDVTEEKAAEEKLREVNARLAAARDQAVEASRAKSAFLANMSHELRTPLNAILGYTEILTEDAMRSGQDALVPDLQTIHGSSKHLLGLINDVLDLSKIEAGRVELILEDVDLGQLIQDVLVTVQPLVDANGNAVEHRGAKDLGRIKTDAAKLRQVLLNLLSNATKFTNQGTVVVESVRTTGPEGEWFRVDVRDSGIGIPKEQLAHLFQAFNRGGGSTARGYEGTGLGLAISQRLCQVMGGSIGVRSEPGEGSTFTVRLPIEAPTVVRAADGPHALTRTASDVVTEPVGRQALADAMRPLDHKDPRRLMIVDDDPTARDVLRRTVEGEGWQVTEAANGRVALRAIAASPPDLILLDLMMPDGDGFDLLRVLRKTQAGRDIPVVVLSAKELTEEDRHKLRGSVQKVLQKGAYSREEVIREVHALLSARPRANVTAPPTAAQPVNGEAPAALQRDVAEARAERDAALARLAEHSAAVSGREEELRTELESVNRALREHQQVVALLQDEHAEATAQLKGVRELEDQVSRLRAERDAALTSAREGERAARRKLFKEVKQLRRRQKQLEESLADRHAAPAVTTPTPPPVRVSSTGLDGWHVLIESTEGQTRRGRATTAQIKSALAEGKIGSTSKVLLSRTAEGPHSPLSSFAEFHDTHRPQRSPDEDRVQLFGAGPKSSSSSSARSASRSSVIHAAISGLHPPVPVALPPPPTRPKSHWVALGAMFVFALGVGILVSQGLSLLKW